MQARDPAPVNSPQGRSEDIDDELFPAKEAPEGVLSRGGEKKRTPRSRDPKKKSDVMVGEIKVDGYFACCFVSDRLSAMLHS